MRSLRSQLFVVWLLSLAAALAVGVMLVGLYRASAGVQQERAGETVAEACAAIADRFGYYATGWAGPLAAAGTADGAAVRADFAEVVAFALGGWPRLAGGVGLAGGLWLAVEGPIGATMALDDDLRATVAALVEAVAVDDRAVATRIVAAGETLLVEACAVRGPLPGLSAFAVARVADAPGEARFRYGLGGLFVLVLGVTLLLGWAVVAWSRRVGGIEAALAQHAAGMLPLLALTGERDLDRIVAALNQTGDRLAVTRWEAEALAGRVAQAERFSALGRVAAGVAHAVRNPVAAMRLRAENALAGDDARRRVALEAILGQVVRLERLTGELLTMTQKRTAEPAPVEIAAFLAGCAADHAGIVRVEAAPAAGLLDAALLRRALDELVGNALRHTPEGETVTLRGAVVGNTLRIEVADSGPGVPEALRKTLFEPFVSGRPDGTGLGLAIAREMVEAHGGQIRLAQSGPGTVFILEVPWRAC